VVSVEYSIGDAGFAYDGRDAGFSNDAMMLAVMDCHL